MEDKKNNFQKEEPVYSTKVKAGRKRTYFIDVRETRMSDFFITITESKKRQDGGYDRHKLYLYKEDFNKFLEGINDVVNHVKTQLMPEYDFDEFSRRQEEYEKQRALDGENGGGVSGGMKDSHDDLPTASAPPPAESSSSSSSSSESEATPPPPGNDEDLKW